MTTQILRTFRHSSIGKKTHAAGTAAAHMKYILRDDACTKRQAENMPRGEYGTNTYFDKIAGQPDAHAAARVADKFMIALPPELTAEQRHELVESFMHGLGKGRIAWTAAHHDKGEDEHNPHVHILFKDRDIDTGKKVIGTTTSMKDVREAVANEWKVPPRMTTGEMRQTWCNHLNKFMEREGIDIQYDARTLKEQGIDRTPQIHVGPKAYAIAEKGNEYASRDRERGERTIPYTMLDQGSRIDFNAQIIEANKAREQKPATREDRDKAELRERQGVSRVEMRQEQAQDRAALAAAHKAELEAHKAWGAKLYADARQRAFETIGKENAPKWQEVRSIGDSAAREKASDELRKQQAKAFAKLRSAEVAKVRPQKDEAWQALNVSHKQERIELRDTHRDEANTLTRQHTAERLATHENWRAYELAKGETRITARLGDRQGMAQVQATAVKVIKHRANARKGGDNQPANVRSMSPAQRARHYTAEAQKEQSQRDSARQSLALLRDGNLARAGLPQGQQSKPLSRAQKDEREIEAKIVQAKQTGKGRTGGGRER